MSGTLGDLNNILFKQLERLSNENLKGEDLEEEMQRAKAVSDIAKNVINGGAIVVQAMKIYDDRMDANLKMPKFLED